MRPIFICSIFFWIYPLLFSILTSIAGGQETKYSAKLIAIDINNAPHQIKESGYTLKFSAAYKRIPSMPVSLYEIPSKKEAINDNDPSKFSYILEVEKEKLPDPIYVHIYRTPYDASKTMVQMRTNLIKTVSIRKIRLVPNMGDNLNVAPGKMNALIYVNLKNGREDVSIDGYSIQIECFDQSKRQQYTVEADVWKQNPNYGWALNMEGGSFDPCVVIVRKGGITVEEPIKPQDIVLPRWHEQVVEFIDYVIDVDVSKSKPLDKDSWNKLKRLAMLDPMLLDAQSLYFKKNVH